MDRKYFPKAVSSSLNIGREEQRGALQAAVLVRSKGRQKALGTLWKNCTEQQGLLKALGSTPGTVLSSDYLVCVRGQVR